MNAAPNDRDTRLKRARMRAWRRGMREMDLILGGFLDVRGASFNDMQIGTFEALLERRDADLYAWVADQTASGPGDASDAERAMMSEIRDHLAMVSKN